MRARSPTLVVRPLDLRSPYNSFYQPTSHLFSIDPQHGSGSAICKAFPSPPTSYFSSAFPRQLGGDNQSMVKGAEDKFKSYFAQSTGRQRRQDGSSPSESQARSTVNSQRSPLVSLSSDRSGPKVDSSKTAISSSQRIPTNPQKPRSALEALARAASQPRGHHGNLCTASDYESDCSSSNRATHISIASSTTSLASTYPESMWKQKKKELVDRLMVHFFAYFRPWIEENFGIESCSDGTHGDGGRAQNSQSTKQDERNTSNSSTTSRKRQQRHHHDEANGEMNPSDDEDNKGNGRRRNKKRARQDGGGEIAQQRFACPYYKNNPKAFKSHRACLGPGWLTTHRLKEHLFRNHSKPDYQCNRCLEDLKSDQELVNHQRLDSACVRKTSKKDMRLSRAQIQDIRAKKTSLTEHQRWEEIYRKIFPGEPMPKSPYCDTEPTELEDLGEFLDKEFPPIYRQVLENEVDHMMGDAETELKNRLVSKVPSLLKKFLEVYCHQNSLGKQHHQDGDSNAPLSGTCRDNSNEAHSLTESCDTLRDPRPQPTAMTAEPLGYHLLGADLEPFPAEEQFLVPGVDSSQLYYTLMNDFGAQFEPNEWNIDGLRVDNSDGASI